MSISKETRQAALMSGASIILAGITLLSLRVLGQSWPSAQFEALLLSLAFCVAACCLLFIRRLGQAHLALGMYLLIIGGATVVLLPLLLPGYGGNDPDMLFQLFGPLYLFTGILLIAVSLINHRHWMESSKTMWVRTALLAGPAAVLSLLTPIALGPRLWDAPRMASISLRPVVCWELGSSSLGADSSHTSNLMLIKRPFLASLMKLEQFEKEVPYGKQHYSVESNCQATYMAL